MIIYGLRDVVRNEERAHSVYRSGRLRQRLSSLSTKGRKHAAGTPRPQSGTICRQLRQARQVGPADPDSKRVQLQHFQEMMFCRHVGSIVAKFTPMPKYVRAGATLPSGELKLRCSPIVLCGPSGVGKSTLIAQLMREFPGDFGFEVSHTTRPPRPGEIHGKDYHFVSLEEMQQGIDEGRFLEHASVHGNLYGTSRDEVERVVGKNLNCILDINLEGARKCQGIHDFFVGSYIFIAPPSVGALEKRLRARGTETEDSIRTRMSTSVVELDEARFMMWDSWIVNADGDTGLDAAYRKLLAHVRPAIAACRQLRQQPSL